ncbi:MAG: Nramp family divalent metal transporter [Lachnospiraceae bacterium]
MANENNFVGSDGFDPSKVKKLSFVEILKRIGPGIVLTGVVIGPGNITTSAMIGANYGYNLLWLIIPILFMGVTFMLTSYRISMLTGMPILHAIRYYYGKAASAFCGVALFLSCLFFTLGNVSGTGAGMNLIFGINWKLGALIMLAVLLVLYFSKGVYSKVEKGIMVCIFGMILAFYATLVATGGPSWQEVGRGLTHWSMPEGSMTTALAYISTNAAVTACIVCFVYGGSPTQLIFIANIATSIATPVAGLFIMLMFWKPEVQGGLKPPRVLQVCMTVSYIFTLFMTVSALANYIPKLIASFTP